MKLYTFLLASSLLCACAWVDTRLDTGGDEWLQEQKQAWGRKR